MTQLYSTWERAIAYGNKKIKIQDIYHTVAPRITLEEKLFISPQEKRISSKQLQIAASLPDSSTVFLSFGEIDCRPNEGFISAANKHKKPIEDLVSDTTRGYVDWFAEQNKVTITICFFNVPAPIYNENKFRSKRRGYKNN